MYTSYLKFSTHYSGVVVIKLIQNRSSMKDSHDGKILSKRMYLQKLKLIFYKIKDAFIS